MSPNFTFPLPVLNDTMPFTLLTVCLVSGVSTSIAAIAVMVNHRKHSKVPASKALSLYLNAALCMAEISTYCLYVEHLRLTSTYEANTDPGIRATYQERIADNASMFALLWWTVVILTVLSLIIAIFAMANFKFNDTTLVAYLVVAAVILHASSVRHEESAGRDALILISIITAVTITTMIVAHVKSKSQPKTEA